MIDGDRAAGIPLLPPPPDFSREGLTEAEAEAADIVVLDDKCDDKTLQKAAILSDETRCEVVARRFQFL